MSDMDALLPQARMARRFMRLTDAQRRAAYAKMKAEGLSMAQFPILPREGAEGVEGASSGTAMGAITPSSSCTSSPGSTLWKSGGAAAGGSGSSASCASSNLSSV